MIRLNSPFKLTTHFRGWNRILAIGLVLSLALNFALVFANVKQAANFSTPRIFMKTSGGIFLPVAAGAFEWTPDVARDYVRIFLPIVYTFTPSGASPIETWSPFINPQLLKATADRFQKNRSQIQSDGLHQTLFVRQVTYDPESESAAVIAELRLIDKSGHVTRTTMNLTVDLITSADPLNAYGHAIHSVH
jgi:hypothetical protein